MATILQLSPLDHGKCFSEEELTHAEYEPGYKYEVIEGALFVTPAPNFPHEWFETSLSEILFLYSRANRHQVGWVATNARVFVPGASRQTIPEPDLSLYRLRPNRPENINWRDLSPFIVIELLSEGTEDKDLVRNVELYLKVPSILEYWVFDLDPDAEAGLIVFRRVNDEWQKLLITDNNYLPDLLPGLKVPTRIESLEENP